MAFATHTGYALIKPHTDTNTGRETPQGLFTGRETPLNEGFRPNTTNFSRRDGTSFQSTTTPTPAHPAPAGIHLKQQQNVPIIPTPPVSNVPILMKKSSSTSNLQGLPPNVVGNSVQQTTSETTTFIGNAGNFTAPTNQSGYVATNTRWNNTPPQNQSHHNNQSTSGQNTVLTPPWAPNATVPAHSTPLPTGLKLRANQRPGKYVSYEHDRVIISRANRGTTDKEKAKIRELCTQAITPQITRANIAKLLASTDESYDIASDATQWQMALGNIWNHIVQYDFAYIAMIPLSFDPMNPTSIDANSTFINAVLNHDKLTD